MENFKCILTVFLFMYIYVYKLNSQYPVSMVEKSKILKF